jgi:hypothetical protein
MDTYKGVALGVEAAWPSTVHEVSVIEVKSAPADQARIDEDLGRPFHSIPNTA